jgi:hypothetical protein
MMAGRAELAGSSPSITGQRQQCRPRELAMEQQVVPQARRRLEGGGVVVLARGGHARDVAGEAECGHVARTGEAEWWLQRPQLLERWRVVRERWLGKATLMVVREVPLVGAAPGTQPVSQGLEIRCLRERSLHWRMGGLGGVVQWAAQSSARSMGRADRWRA